MTAFSLLVFSPLSVTGQLKSSMNQISEEWQRISKYPEYFVYTKNWVYNRIKDITQIHKKDTVNLYMCLNLKLSVVQCRNLFISCICITLAIYVFYIND